MKTMQKRKSHAFGKDVYLLGKDKYGDILWLEEPSWDCEWYWGFGYVETFTNPTKPNFAKDITQHRHWRGLLSRQDNGSCIHHINEVLDESVLSDAESWEVSDLMRSAYSLKEVAGIFYRGNSHLTSQVRLNLKDEEMCKPINKVFLPEIFKAIREILQPN